ncbi:c-type cytochrome [Halomonas piscis]|uniref:c-type cytochrome n=1 Tax=Halomonas piscis TaxID=3031727 RepID=UPI00289824E9|nr:cytochrome c [Halomonas piscis]
MRTIPQAALAAAIMLSTAALSGTAVADGDPEAGEGKVAACAACHGQDGMASADTYPNLAGQSATYLKSALTAYREGNRKGGMSSVMEPQAASLSDEDIADIAAYYSQQQPDCASADDEG